jgi:hypothetical protein
MNLKRAADHERPSIGDRSGNRRDDLFDEGSFGQSLDRPLCAFC